VYLLATFLFGAMVSGLCTEIGRRRAWESIYVLPIAIEAALLASFAIGLEFTDQSDRASGMTVFWLTGVASMAMGLQNATITRISSGVVRTTHVTGVLTDLGLESMQFLLWVLDRRKDSPPNPVVALVRSVRVHPTTKRLALLVSIVGSFALGAGMGAVAHNSVERWAMFPPVVFLLWLIFRDVAIPIAEIEPSALVGGEDGLDLPPSIAIFHVRQDLDRRRRMHQLPDLQAWADRLPATARIVVLDMGEKSNFDTSAVLELRAVLATFALQGRRLVIAGVGPAQLDQIRRAGASDFLDPTSVCPDFELAIARAIALVEHLPAHGRTRA
jgi:uncharacterized membrane protein YoaK (UPF0700 family)